MAGRLTLMSERSFEKLGISEGYILLLLFYFNFILSEWKDTIYRVYK